MAFDACMMRAQLHEFTSLFPEAKIEKVLQPQNDEIDLVIHYGKSSKRLVFNVGPNAPRLQLSTVQKENPKAAPMFCMLLRKYLTGGRIVRVEQPGFDRIAIFTVACFDDMGFPTTRKIVCEIMGKYANLILLDSEDKILSALKIIDFSASTVRQVLPGMKYRLPAAQDKLSPLEINKDAFFEKLSAFSPDARLEKFITSTYLGIATQIARELVFRVTGRCDSLVSEVAADDFYKVFSEWQELLVSHSYAPTLAIDSEGKPFDYSYMNISYLEGSADISHEDTFYALFDRYFAERDRILRVNQRAHDLIKILNNTISRTERKLALQRESLLESEKGEEYRRCGDLITANMYRIKRGMESFSAVDYSDENMPEVTVTLDSRLSPAQNAQRMYKLYNKSKTAKKVLAEQIALWEKELLYLDGVREFLSRAECEDDLMEIRDELYRSGYASRMKGYKPPKQIKARPYKFVTSGGFVLLVGRNNLQNDNLTLKIADKEDIWFHTKDIPGSHVILVTDGKEPGDGDYTEAAQAAAYFSKAGGDLVAVDYTRVKNIKKPQGSKPGFVIYKTNYTAYVKRQKPGEIQNG